MEFKINLDDKPHLSALLKSDRDGAKNIIGTFVSIMELAAKKNWHKLPQTIHTSLSFQDVVEGVLNAVMTTSEINPEAYATLESDLHPLALLSDKRKDLITGEQEVYNWKRHFSLETKEVSREALEEIIRKMLYLVRWFDIDTVSHSLITNQFPVFDAKDVLKLPFQPALKYQKEHLGDLHVGKFFHDIGAFNCGYVEESVDNCPACKVGTLETVNHHKVCPRCNAGFALLESANQAI